MKTLKKIVVLIAILAPVLVVGYGCYTFHVLEVGGTGPDHVEGYCGPCDAPEYDMDFNLIKDSDGTPVDTDSQEKRER